MDPRRNPLKKTTAPQHAAAKINYQADYFVVGRQTVCRQWYSSTLHAWGSELLSSSDHAGGISGLLVYVFPKPNRADEACSIPRLAGLPPKNRRGQSQEESANPWASQSTRRQAWKLKHRWGKRQSSPGASSSGQPLVSPPMREALKQRCST